MHKSQSLFYLTTALHDSGVTITHLQEHKTTVTTASGNRYTVLSAAIVEELELIWVCCGWPQVTRVYFITENNKRRVEATEEILEHIKKRKN